MKNIKLDIMHLIDRKYTAPLFFKSKGGMMGIKFFKISVVFDPRNYERI